MIGLLDYDIQTSKSSTLFVPNLEIMKLATYYRLEENVFCKLISLDTTDLSSYDKIFFFSETSVNPNIPQHFLNAKNVEFGGTAFTNKIYVPFKNPIIDYTIARPEIYKTFLKEKYQLGVKTKVLEHTLDDSYYRMYAGEEKLPIPPINKTKRIYIFDRDILTGKWEQILSTLSSRNPASIITIHPTVCKTFGQFFKLRENLKFSRANIVILDTNIPLDEVHYMLKMYTKKLLAEITKSSSVCLYLGGTYKSTHQYWNDFIYKMNLLYSFWSKGINIKIKYDHPIMGYKDPMANISQSIEKWTSGDIMYSKTLEDRLTKQITKEKKELFALERDNLLKLHPSAKSLFFENFTTLKERGIWKI